MQNDPFRIPTDDEIAIAERKLGITFHNDYRCFLKSGSDVANAIFEAAVILPDAGRLDIFEMAKHLHNTLKCYECPVRDKCSGFTCQHLLKQWLNQEAI